MSGGYCEEPSALQLARFFQYPQRSGDDVRTVISPLRFAHRRPRAAGLLDLPILDGRDRAARHFDVVLAAALHRMTNRAARLFDGVVAP